MTSTERQRLFRRRHPGYYSKYKARDRAMREATRAMNLAAAAARAAELSATPGALPPPVPMLPKGKTLIVRLESIPFPR